MAEATRVQSDQCATCMDRGNLADCKAVPAGCTIHGTWYAKAQDERIAEQDERIAFLEKSVTSLLARNGTLQRNGVRLRDAVRAATLELGVILEGDAPWVIPVPTTQDSTPPVYEVHWMGRTYVSKISDKLCHSCSLCGANSNDCQGIPGTSRCLASENQDGLGRIFVLKGGPSVQF